MTGIEPALVAWEATVLPLNYTRVRYWILIPFLLLIAFREIPAPLVPGLPEDQPFILPCLNEPAGTAAMLKAGAGP